MPITLVNTVSVAYSGSTFLNLLLGAHRQIFGAGEVGRLFGSGQRVECTVHGASCPIWSRFDPRAAEHPARQMHQLSGKPVVVVNNAYHRLPPFEEPDGRLLFIHLVRDGRAVAASFLRKRPGVGMWKAARWWLHEQRDARQRLAAPPEAPVLHVRYERLMSDTPGEARRVCDFLGVEYDPAMLEYWAAEQHYIGGNLGTLYGVLKKAERETPTEQLAQRARQAPREWDLEHYRQADPAAYQDERWKAELSDNQLRLFGLLAGRVNRRLGYPRSLDRGDRAEAPPR